MNSNFDVDKEIAKAANGEEIDFNRIEKEFQTEDYSEELLLQQFIDSENKKLAENIKTWNKSYMTISL